MLRGSPAPISNICSPPPRSKSRFNPNAAAPTSSARGLFQFIEQTWLATLKEQGPALGYGKIADAIDRGPSGQYMVTDPRLTDRIMKLRNDPTANAVMAAAYTKENAGKLAGRLGRNADRGRALRRALPGVERRRPADLARRIQAARPRAPTRHFRDRPRPIHRSSTTRGGRAVSPKCIACWSTATPWRATHQAAPAVEQVAAVKPTVSAATAELLRRTRLS